MMGAQLGPDGTRDAGLDCSATQYNEQECCGIRTAHLRKDGPRALRHGVVIDCAGRLRSGCYTVPSISS